MSNLPPGVSGNEYQISGVLPPEAVVDNALEEVKAIEDKLEELIADLEDQNFPTDRIDDYYEGTRTNLQHLRDVLNSSLPNDC